MTKTTGNNFLKHPVTVGGWSLLIPRPPADSWEKNNVSPKIFHHQTPELLTKVNLKQKKTSQFARLPGFPKRKLL